MSAPAMTAGKALQRIISSAYPTSRTIQLFLIRPTQLQTRLPLPSCRSLSRYRAVKASASHGGQLPDSILDTLDERIGTRMVRIINEETNAVGERELLHTILGNIRGTEQHVRKVDEDGEGIPLVKIVTRASLNALASMRDLESKRKDVAETAKQLELNWAIDENDLRHRLKRLADFLRQGKRVELMIAPKKAGRRAEHDEILNLLDRIKEAVEEVEGAKEVKPMEGLPGKVVELVFEGPRTKVSTRELVDAKLDKRSKKHEEKEARRLKDEARLARRQEEWQRLEAENERMRRQVAEDRKSRAIQ